MRKPFVALEIEHWVMGDLFTTLEIIANPREAEEFAEAYEAVCGEENATHNLRYMLRIISVQDSTEAQRVADLFMVEVPDRELEPRQTFGNTSYGIGEISKPKPKLPLFESGKPELSEQISEMFDGSKKSSKKLKRVAISERPGA